MLEIVCSARGLSLILGLGRSPGEGNDNQLQYSCLGNPMEEQLDGLQCIGPQ